MRKDAEGHPIIDNLNQVDGYLAERNKRLDKDKFYQFKDGTIKVDHLAAADAIIRFINAVPNMDRHVREIMIMRIGSPAMKGVKMSHMAIALAKGMSEDEVVFLEKIGVKMTNEYMERVTLLDGMHSGSGKGVTEEILNRVSTGKLKKTK